VLAVWLGRGEPLEALRRPLAAVAAVTLGAFVVLAAVQGSEWTVGHYFWIDILFGIGIASLLALMYAGGFGAARRFLASRALMFLGLFSYSIYLIHDPIVGTLHKYIFGPLDVSPLATFAISLALGLPLVLTFCYGFHLLFEAPFLRHRHLSAVKTIPIVQFWLERGRRRGARPVAPVEELPGPALVPTPQAATGDRSAG
jgi:peptidoglycan/LPS O-acetylase OafA/YrhL